MTRFINNDETASQNITNLLTTNSKASYENTEGGYFVAIYALFNNF